MRTGLLRGSEHTQLGAISLLAEGRAAIALSRGGAPKSYNHRDPNEDACAFAYDGGAWLVAVADGHWGHGGAALALERVLEHHAPRWLAPPALASLSLEARWQGEAPDVLADLNHTLLAAGGEALIGRTTLALCVRPAGSHSLLVLAVGDSHAFEIRGARAVEHCPLPGGARPCYLGDPGIDRRQLQSGARAAVVDVETSTAVLLATDGLSEPGIGVGDPAGSAARAASEANTAEWELRPVQAARGLAEGALDAQRSNRAGDNVATACLWLE